MKFKIRAVSGLITLVTIVVFCACNKYDETGTTILPLSDTLNLVYTDSTTIICTTIREDSLRSNGFSGFPVSLNIVGSLNEPIFGRTKASVYMQMNLSKLNFDYGDSATADSLILCLALNSYYGNSHSPVHFRIYRMDSLINKDSAYYTNTTLPAATLIGDATVAVNPKDSLSEYGIKKAPHIRIPLDMVLATELMSKSGGPEYVDNTAFTNYFKGIYITAESANDPGCMFVYDYKSTQSKMSLYYKFSVDSDSLSFNYTFDELARFNHFDHDYYAGTEVYQALNDNTTGNNFTYVQSMAGVKTKIQLPYIKNYLASDPSMVINNAVLVFKAEPNSLFAPHANTALTYVDSAGHPQDFAPDNNESANSTDGTYLSTPGEYRFNITRYISQVMTGKRTDYGIYLRGVASIINPHQTKLYGSSNPTGKIKLEITYTKF
ncbi:MAG: DUF4270 domain-containing protein [Bacteroidia bacterium]